MIAPIVIFTIFELIIHYIYPRKLTSDDGKSTVSLFERDGSVWLNQLQMAELFATSKPNINMHIANILKDKELNADSVIKDYLTTAVDGGVCPQNLR